MVYTYHISGMTCGGCVETVKQALLSLDEISSVEVNLSEESATVEMNLHIDLSTLSAALPDKYSIEAKEQARNIFGSTVATSETVEKSKLQQLKPLLLIFAYLIMAVVLLNKDDWKIASIMYDFMGLFFIVFSFFKLLDLKGFPESFRMYDPLAKAIPAYSWIYPFIEIALGIMFLMRFQLEIALIVTLIVLGITTIGVIRSLMDKRVIRCACLGTALNLPMTEATLIENSIMLIMAVLMLIKTMGL